MATEQLPNWKIDNIFTDTTASDFLEAVETAKRNVDELEQYLNENDVGAAGETGMAPSRTIEGVLTRMEELNTRLGTIFAYLQLRVDTDAFDEDAQAHRSSLRPLMSRVSVLSTRFTAWIGKVDLEAAAQDSELVREHEYALQRFAQMANHLMGEEAEELAAVLGNTGGNAWAQLHSALISRETIAATLPGKEGGQYNVAELKQLQSDPDREVRKAAYEAEVELLSGNEVSYAAAMNSIKGQVLELSKRRGWESPLAQSLFTNAMSRGSLDAMQQAVRESFPVFRRYMKAKAKFLGRENLAWYDLFAPVSIGEPQEFSWNEAREFVIDNFSSYSPRLAEFAARAFDERWMDAPSKKGKVNGAYCMRVVGRKESRILLNFGGTLDDVFTIAHELGHGFHNDSMFRFGRTTLQASTPMTLAETASIFCETIVMNAMLKEASDTSKLAILEQDLVGANQVVVDIDSRFRFEDAVFNRRAERELSVGEMKEIMLQAQEDTYGEGVDPQARHDLMWAHKGHYYSAGRSYYNYPYTFGLLFGLGLYSVFGREPEGFQERYEKLLASTGMAPAADLAREFGIDIEDVEFWRGSLAIYEDRVRQYEELVEQNS